MPSPSVIDICHTYKEQHAKVLHNFHFSFIQFYHISHLSDENMSTIDFKCVSRLSQYNNTITISVTLSEGNTNS